MRFRPSGGDPATIKSQSSRSSRRGPIPVVVSEARSAASRPHDETSSPAPTGGMLARLLGELPEYLWIFDEELCCVYRSEMARTSPSFPGDESVGHRLGEFMNGDGEELVTAAAQAALADPGGLHCVDIVAVPPSGVTFRVQARIRAIEEDGQRFLVLTARDVS